VPEMRRNPLNGLWVIVAPERAARPDMFRTADRQEDDRGDAVACPFCPGNEGLTPPEISAYRKDDGAPDGPGWSVRVIPEADPYFRIELDLAREGVGMYDKISPRGATELIVESPRHEDTPATMPKAQWEQVLWMYAERIRDLKRDLAIRDILITRRHRQPGSRITHPYSRLIAIPIIFDEVRRKLTEAREYFQYKRRCVYCDIIRQETADEVRVIWETPHFVALVPYAARAPHEAWILPRQHACSYEEALTPESVADLASLLGGYFRTLVTANSRSIFSFTRPWENSTATRMAFLMAFPFERPWQMMPTPLTPSNGAPPYSE